MIKFILKFLKDEKGQAMAEYVLVVVFIGLSIIVITQAFPAAIGAYLGRIFSLVSLPIP